MTLHTEHLTDLRKSGLTPDTIATLQFESVRPQSLRKFPGVTSAYTIPYWDFDGTKNGFERLKLFPPITTPDGRTQKYSQPKGSHPHLYLLPDVDWRAVANDPQLNIVIPEGEKKTAALAQVKSDAATVGISGVWNWCQRLNGERVLIPTLDLFNWKGRSVSLLPDSDVWRPDKEQALRGFFALAMELTSRGATVHFIKLPELDGVKCGIDDWLVQEGTGWVTSWAHLETVALDNARLVACSAWWQKWNSNHAAEEFQKSTNANEMTVTRAGGRHTAKFPAYRVRLHCDRLTDARGSVTAELSVLLGDTPVLEHIDIGLKSDAGRERIAKTLKEAHPSIPWKQLLMRACPAILKTHRIGEPVYPVLPVADRVRPPLILDPFVYGQGCHNLMYAPGGSLKSFTGMYFALLAMNGLSQNGIKTMQTKVLYLDWETNVMTAGGSLKQLQTGHPELVIAPAYRKCIAPLYQDADCIAGLVADLGIGLIVIDSCAMACGSDLNSPETVMKLQRALAIINCPSLMFAHMAKYTPDGYEATAYGSVFFREFCRDSWELKKVSEPGDTTPRVTFTHQKHNFGAKHDPVGLQFQFERDSVRVTACDPDDAPEGDGPPTLTSRIRNFLDQDGGARTAQDIATILTAKLGTVERTLRRYRGKKWSAIGEGKDTVWTVVHPQK